MPLPELCPLSSGTDDPLNGPLGLSSVHGGQYARDRPPIRSREVHGTGRDRLDPQPLDATSARSRSYSAGQRVSRDVE